MAWVISVWNRSSIAIANVNRWSQELKRKVGGKVDYVIMDMVELENENYMIVIKAKRYNLEAVCFP